MAHFDTDKKPLTFLLDQIENRELALPDFQRSFVWDPNATRELVVSIIRSFPAGTLLVMQGGANVFAPRAFEEAPELNAPPLQLVLDGQQRLTSLYQAFSGHGTHRFLLNVRELIDGLDVDEAVEVYLARRARRWSDIDAQADDLMLPLDKLRSFSDWKDDVLDVRQEATEGEDIRKLKTQLNEVERDYIKPVELYQFPVTTLAASTPAEAVCTIFETLNRTGVRLSPFELITARAFAGNVRLREMWERALREHDVLVDYAIDPYYILQVIATSSRGSPKRSVVLSLDVDEIVTHWPAAIRGMAESLRCLRDDCGVLTPWLLPYAPMLVTMASAWSGVSDARGPAQGGRRQKLIRWFWCGIFGGSYDNSPNSKTERDVPQLLRWFESDDAVPTVIRTFGFDPKRWREITVRQRALYRASLALLMRNSPREFHKGAVLNLGIIRGQAVDDHHVFPRKFLADSKQAVGIDAVLNHTLIDHITNIRIGGRAPSVYLKEMHDELGGELLKQILRGHGLPEADDGSLRQDRFVHFLDDRLRYLMDQLSEAAGATADEYGILRAHEWNGEVVELEEESDESAAAVPDEVGAFIASRAEGSEDAAIVATFLRQIAMWPDVRLSVTRSDKSTDGWARSVMAHRRGSNLGAFAYVNPKGRAVVRLAMADPSAEGVQIRNVKESNPYRVRVHFNASNLEAAVALVRAAYEATFR